MSDLTNGLTDIGSINISCIHDNAPKLIKFDPSNPPDIKNPQFQQTYGRTHIASGGQWREEHWSNGYYSIAWYDRDLIDKGQVFVYSNTGREAFKLKYLLTFNDPDPAVPFAYYDIKNPTYLTATLNRHTIHEQNLPMSCGIIPDDPDMAYDRRTKLAFNKNAYVLFVKTLLDIETLVSGATADKWHILKTNLKQELETQLATF